MNTLFFLIKNFFKKKKIKLKNYIHRNFIIGGYNVFGINNYLVGGKIDKYTYIGNNNHITNTSIGKFCSIGSNLRTVIGTHPYDTYFSTSPIFYSSKIKYSLTKNNHDFEVNIYKYSIEVKNDVWIGDNVTILQGVKINNGVVIGAGSVVTKECLAYGIYAGNPAKLLKYRFDDQTILMLLNSNWWNYDENKLKEISKLIKVEELKDYLNEKEHF